MSFSAKLSFAIFFTGIIALVIFSFVMFRFSSKEVLKSQFYQTKSIANEVADDLDHLLSEKINTALTLANTPILKNVLEVSNFSYVNLSDEKREESIKFLNKQWKSIKDPNDKFFQKFTDNKVSHFLKSQQTVLKGEYGEIFLTNKFGALVASTSKLSTFAHGQKYWWLGSYNNGVGAVFFDDRGYDESVGGYVLGLVVPIREDKEVIGILKCNLNILGNVSELILGAEDKLIGKFKLARSGGMVVFEEGFEPLTTQLNDDIFQKIKNKNNEIFILNDSGEKYLVGFSEVNMTKGRNGYGFGGTFESIDHKKGNAGESWYVLCYRKVSIAQAPIIASMKRGAIVGSLIILILVLVSYLFAKKIAKPILILDKATRKIGEGDFEYRIELKQKDEFGNLAHSFNIMASQLKHTTTSIKLLENEIRERKSTQNELQKSETKYRNLIETSGDWIWEVNAEGIYTYSSPQIEELLGYKPEEILGKTPFDLMPPEEAVRIEGVLTEMIKKGAPIVSVENINMHKDGRLIIFETRGVPVFDETGALVFYRGVDRDITERKRAEVALSQAKQEADEANQAKSEFLANMSHEIRTPMSGIIGMTQLALDTELKPVQQKYLENIKKSADSLLGLLNDILDFSKIEAGQLLIEKYSFNLMNLLDNLYSIMAFPAEEKGLALIFERDAPDLPSFVNGDELRLRQILVNLIGNSIKFTEKGSVTLKVIPDAREDNKVGLHFMVVDNGIGIPVDKQSTIFSTFNQADTSTTRNFGGTGLGLTICKQLVEMMDGKIWLESIPGQGTTFHFTIVLDHGTEEPLRRQDDAIVPQIQKLDILLVDDNKINCEIARHVLEKNEHRIATAENGLESLELLTSQHFDLILMDVQMPVMDGLTACTIIRASELGKELQQFRLAQPLSEKLIQQCKGKHIPIIAMTANAMDGDKEKCLAAGMDSYLTKPFQPTQLRSVVADIVKSTPE